MDEARRIGRVLPRSSQFAFFQPEDAPQGLLDRPVDCCGLPLQLGSPSQPIDVSGARKAVSLTDDAQPSWLPIQPLANYIPSLSREDSRRLVAQGWGDEDEPAGPGDTATFGHLAALSQRETPDGRLQGRPMLACLKADVDRLGMLFSRGFGRNVSFGRIASLSRLLDRFFQGFLPSQFAQERSPFRHVYTVFSGGDDLMLIGPWPTMFDLAPRIPAWLDELSGSNPDITLSAALVLGNPRTPPTVLAELGDEQLDRAKEAGRNKVSVFGRLLSWPQLRGALDTGRRLDAMLQDAAPGLKLNTSFVYRVLTHARAAERVAIAAENHRPVILRDVTWRSHLLYDIHRNIEEPLGDRATSQQREDLAWLKSLLYVGMNASDLSAAVVAVTYALYMNRGS
jgi:CRISPR-associated protein Csm1